MKKATLSELKQTNLKSVQEFIYRRKKTTQSEISATLQLSRPTVSQIVKELIEQGIIVQSGHFQSTGGRKPNALRFNPRSHIAIGVELLKESFEIVAIDLYGIIIRSERHLRDFMHNRAYIEEVCAATNAFIDSLGFGEEQVLGVSIVLQGLISADGTVVTYGKILDCTGLSIQEFTPYIKYPCVMIHDGEAAATQELWFSPDVINAIFVHIRWNMSGALIVGGKFLKANVLKSGVFEHMTLIPGGRPCYCGKCGCVETYCSINAILEGDETLADFFHALREDAPAAVARWQEYLRYLSAFIDNLHMMIDYDVILGGLLGRNLIPSDIDILHRMISAQTAFPSERRYIRISESAPTPIAVGAALPYVIQHLGFQVD